MGGPAIKRARGEQTRRNTGAATHAKSAEVSDETGAGADPMDRVVVLNVGGTCVTTLQSTLCSSPSLLATWAMDNFRDFPRDEHGRPFLDRDPQIFNHIINYLRGYGLPCKADDLVVVAEDAQLYQLEALKREIGLDPPSMWRFTAGPGVREDGAEFSTSDILDLCGTEPLSTGLVHTIVFRMDKCELVSVGVVAFKEAKLDSQIRRQKNSVCYCNTGEFVRFWSADPLYDQGVLYKSQDEITVRVEFAQPGVPLEAAGELQGERALPPPLQPALRLGEPLPSSVATAGASSTGGVPPARPTLAATTMSPVASAVAPALATPTATTPATAAPGGRSTFALGTGAPSEPNVTASALQPGSPVMDATTARGATAIAGTVPTTAAPTAPTNTAPTANATNPTTNTNANTAAPASSTGVPPLGSPSSAPSSAAGAAPPSPSLPVAPIVLDPEDPDATIGAIVTFFKADKEVCRARWPAPVPPLQFAVSMQGASAVSILRASSVSAEAATVEAEQ